MIEQLLTVRDVADALSVSVRTVWRLADSGQLPTPIRMGSRLTRWKAADIQLFIDTRNHKPQQHTEELRP